MHDLELELLATRELLADQEDAHLKGRREWEEMINNVMKGMITQYDSDIHRC